MEEIKKLQIYIHIYIYLYIYIYSKTDKSLLKSGKNNIRTPIQYYQLCYIIEIVIK